jgi:hypothetical protein
MCCGSHIEAIIENPGAKAALFNSLAPFNHEQVILLPIHPLFL